MSTPGHIAAIRFGFGLRLGEAPPADPRAWLLAQLSATTPAPTGPTAVEAGRLRSAAARERRDRRQAEAARAAPQPGASTPPAQDAAAAREGLENTAKLQQLLRDESRGWATRRLTTAEPFRERLVDFWMNHFTVSRRNNLIAPLVGTLERDAIRPHLTGRFADMLVAVTRHPAMLMYLDNHVSIGPNSVAARGRNRGLNENLAREVLELHTLSPAGGYTQGDVQELSRILTGWSVSADAEPFDFTWRPNAHEPGEKSLLGRRFPAGEGSQEAALRFIGTHPATWRHLAVKLARHFVADDPPPEAVRALEAVLRQTEGDLGATCRALVALPQAWAPPLSKFRRPSDYVLAVTRAAGIQQPEPVIGGMQALGQPLWTAPQPNGWADDLAGWSGPEALLRRTEWAYSLAGAASRADIAAVTEAGLGPLAPASTVAAMRGAGSVRDALTLLFGSPEFMRR